MLIWRAGALDDVVEAHDWYLSRSDRAAERFEDELDKAVQTIEMIPRLYALSTAGMRKALFRTLPYAVFYEEAQDGVEIFAVAHAKRRSGYWIGRLK